MKSINQITADNFQNMFNLKDILDNSVFYPASGTDGRDIECLSEKYCSFVHADYSIPKNEVEQSMRSDFEDVGYDLLGIKDLDVEELTQGKIYTDRLLLNEHERNRLRLHFIREKFDYENFEPFALWAVYELNPQKTDKIKGKVERFSLLHIGGEACATFDSLYLTNKINPSAIVIIGPGEGYGMNWTLFSDPNFRFYKNLQINAEENNSGMPVVLLTSSVNPYNLDDCFWPNCLYLKEYITNDELSVYLYFNWFVKGCD